MFDTDGNEMVDKKEFLVVGTWFTAFSSNWILLTNMLCFVILWLLLESDASPESNKQGYTSSNIYLMEV